MCISVCKGLLWLLLATIAEVPSAVRMTIFWTVLFRSSLFHGTGVHDFEFEW